MILKIRMSADVTKVYETRTFTKKLMSPKMIDGICGYKDGILVSFAEGMPTKRDLENYSKKNWKEITIVGLDRKVVYVNYTPNEIYVLNDNGKTIDTL